MIKKLLLSNSKGESLDLLKDFCFAKNELAFNWVNNNILLEQNMKIASGRLHKLPVRKLDELTACLTYAQWDKVRDLFVKDQEELTIVYDNGVNAYTFSVDELPDVTYKPVSNTEYVNIGVTFTQLSHMFNIKKYTKIYNPSFTGSTSKYAIQFGEFKYGSIKSSPSYNVLKVQNTGDTFAPFRLIIPKGGNNIEVELYSKNRETRTLKLNGNYTGMQVIIDMYNTSITADGVEISYFLDLDYLNWFNLDYGYSIINVKNVEDYTVEVRNIRRVP